MSTMTTVSMNNTSAKTAATNNKISLTASSATSSTSSSSSSSKASKNSNNNKNNNTIQNNRHNQHVSVNNFQQQLAINIDTTKNSNSKNIVDLQNTSTMANNNNNNSSSNYMHHEHQHHHQQQQHSPFSNITNNSNNNNQSNLIEIKSKFDAEFRRFSIQRSEITNLQDFIKLIEHFHNLFTIPFCLFYTDPIHGDLLPINNDTNFALAIASAKPLLRLIVQRKGESIDYLNNYVKKKNFLGNILPVVSSSSSAKNRLAISAPEDFRQVSSIIDVDIVPETCRRVRLVKHGSDKPLGFYIRDGNSVRITEHGLEKVPGIFISRLVPGGLAESTGLLAVNDEVLEVNGIEVNGKSLDQVTDMMVANSSNLIITIRPANQRALAAGHNTLSSSYSSNTISNYHHHHHPHYPNVGAASLAMNQSMTIDRHPHHLYHNHHYLNNPHYHGPSKSSGVSHYTNSLERSGHRSKVSQVDYYGNMYNEGHNYNNQKSDQQQITTSSSTNATKFRPHASTSSYQLPTHSNYSHNHHRTHSTSEMIQVIENDHNNDDDDDDEDEIRDHFNPSLNSGAANINVASNSNTTLTVASPPQIFTTNVYTISNPSTVECVTIGPSSSSSTSNAAAAAASSNNKSNNNKNNGIDIGQSPYINKHFNITNNNNNNIKNSDANATSVMSISNNNNNNNNYHLYHSNRLDSNYNQHKQQQQQQQQQQRQQQIVNNSNYNNNNNNSRKSSTQSSDDSDIVTL